MSDLQDDLDDAVARLRRAGTDLQDVEVKAAAGGFPKTAVDSVSAFANADGGLLILGLDENLGFAAVQIDARQRADDLAAACAEQLEPPVRADIDIAEVDGLPVVVAAIHPLPPKRKPCYVKARGIERGSYLRTHDGDRMLSTYEVHILLSSHGQPADDLALVPGATLTDLDSEALTRLLRRLRDTRGQIFERASDDEILRMMRVVADGPSGPGITLAGILALGRYPQQFFPQLDITFVAYPTTTGEPLADGTRFTDNLSIDGSIPAMVSSALSALRRNMKRRSVIVGLGREDRWEYPEEAVREIVANALIHRDYNPLAAGTQVRVALYPDRLEVGSPGGLFGPITSEDLFAEPISSSRNGLLAKLLEDVEVAGTGRTVCENRGSGLLATAAALRSAGMEPPQVMDNLREFKVVIGNHGLLDDDAVAWLSTIDTDGLTDRQRLALAFLRRHRRLTNQQYRSLTGCDSATATRDLAGLATAGLTVKTSDRRWTVWHLVDDLRPAAQATLDLEPERPKRADRRAAIRAVLRSGPVPTRVIAEGLGISREATIRWLRRMETDGEVRTTSAKRRSSHNMWELVQGPP